MKKKMKARVTLKDFEEAVRDSRESVEKSVFANAASCLCVMSKVVERKTGRKVSGTNSNVSFHGSVLSTTNFCENGTGLTKLFDISFDTLEAKEIYEITRSGKLTMVELETDEVLENDI